MKSLLPRALLVLGILSIASIGCQTPEPEDETLTDELSQENAPGAEEQVPPLTPICQDTTILEFKQVFCGFPTGPNDLSPIYVTCERECFVDRYMVFTPDGVECAIASKDCDPWDCPPCD